MAATHYTENATHYIVGGELYEKKYCSEGICDGWLSIYYCNGDNFFEEIIRLRKANKGDRWVQSTNK